MREKFKGYYRPTPAEENEMWASAHIVMDTNVVLDLYKYHAKTADLYLRSLSKFKDQLWLPYQVASEFHKNRPKVRAETTRGHKERIKDLENIKNKIQQNTPKSKLASSQVENELIAKTEEAIGALKKELSQLAAETHVNAPDKLLDSITDLFEGRVGDAPTPEGLVQLEAEAKQRFDNLIPPGYEDRKTKAPGDEFGDFYLWQQTMEYAKGQQKNIILATEDTKADWWLKVNGDIVGPRPELIQEFRAVTGQEIIIYSGRNFFKELSDRAKITLSSEDLAGALADVTSVSDERTTSELTRWLAATKVDLDIADGKGGKWRFTHRPRKPVDEEAIATLRERLSEQLAILSLRESDLRQQLAAISGQLRNIMMHSPEAASDERVIALRELQLRAETQLAQIVAEKQELDQRLAETEARMEWDRRLREDDVRRMSHLLKLDRDEWQDAKLASDEERPSSDQSDDD